MGWRAGRVVVDIRQLVVVVQVIRLALHLVKVMLAVLVQPMQPLLHQAAVAVVQVRLAALARLAHHQTVRVALVRLAPSQGQVFTMRVAGAAHQTVQPQLAVQAVLAVAVLAVRMVQQQAFLAQQTQAVVVVVADLQHHTHQVVAVQVS